MIIKDLGLKDYEEVWNNMKDFTKTRTKETKDEIWLLEHPPVYTQGQAGKKEHIINPKNIKIVQSDRGGQVTYHGPGQLVAYILMDINRINLGVRTLVCYLEKTLINLLKELEIDSYIKEGAPGVYVDGKKIASIGLRVKNGCAYHGIALNVDMDLSPFAGINPCGYEGLSMCQIKDFHENIQIGTVKELFIKHINTFFEK